MSNNRAIVESNDKHYSRDSFERFGDDLCEELLSYLTIEDKIRFECVSKQWRSLVLNRQSILFFDYNTEGGMDFCYRLGGMDNFTKNKLKNNLQNKLKNLLKKFPYIRQIDFGNTSIDYTIVDIVVECCPRLESIVFNIKDVDQSAITRFGQRFGHQIKAINFQTFVEYIYYFNQKLLIDLCPKVERLTCDDFWRYDKESVKPLMRLKKLRFRCHTPDDQLFRDINRLAPNLKSLELLSFTTGMSLTITKSVPMVNLTSLRLFDFGLDQEFFANLPRLIPNVENLQLLGHFKPSDTMLHHLAELSAFRTIVIDSINYDHDITDSGIIYLLDNCYKLNNINIYHELFIGQQIIDKLYEISIRRPEDSISFQCFGDTEELIFHNKPNNLSIKFLDLI